MLVIPINKITVKEKNAIVSEEMNVWTDMVIAKYNFNINKEELIHNYLFEKNDTNIYSIQGFPNNLANITTLSITENINGEDITTNILVDVVENNIILTVNSTMITIENLTDKSQLLLKPQLINSKSYWTIVYNNNIVAQFPAEKMPNNYINNMMFDIKDINIDENDKLIFETVNP